MKIFYSILFLLSVGGLFFTDFMFLAFFNQRITIWLIIGFLTTIVASTFILYLSICRFLKQPPQESKKKN